MAQIGNRINSGINGEWAAHVRSFGKRLTAGLRRLESKKIIREETETLKYDYWNELLTSSDPFDLDGYCSFHYASEYFAWNDPDDDCVHRFIKESPKHLYPMDELCVLKKAA